MSREKCWGCRKNPIYDEDLCSECIEIEYNIFHGLEKEIGKSRPRKRFRDYLLFWR